MVMQIPILNLLNKCFINLLEIFNGIEVINIRKQRVAMHNYTNFCIYIQLF